jgi:hypothetical protein
MALFISTEVPADVGFGSEADMARSNCDVRFTPNTGHPSAQSKCPLWTNSGLMHRSKNGPLFDHLVGYGE